MELVLNVPYALLDRSGRVLGRVTLRSSRGARWFGDFDPAEGYADTRAAALLDEVREAVDGFALGAIDPIHAELAAEALRLVDGLGREVVGPPLEAPQWLGEGAFSFAWAPECGPGPRHDAP